MKTISTTQARKDISKIISMIAEQGNAIAIGRRNNPEALLIKFPKEYSACVNEITNVNAYSDSFSFLADEPDLYTTEDLKKRYV